MSSPEQTPDPRPGRERRVGTFTFGAVLVICGVLMLVSMFFPALDLTLARRWSSTIESSCTRAPAFPRRGLCLVSLGFPAQFLYNGGNSHAGRRPDHVGPI